MEKEKKKINVIYTNKNTHNYLKIEEFKAGMVLSGWMPKSLDDNRGDISTSWIGFNNDFLVIKNWKITPMKHHNIKESEIPTEIKLLLKKSELRKIKEYISINRYTCIPFCMYRDTKNFKWKINFSVVKQMKNYEKREAIKKKDIERDLKRIE